MSYIKPNYLTSFFFFFKDTEKKPKQNVQLNQISSDVLTMKQKKHIYDCFSAQRQCFPATWVESQLPL